MKNFSFQKTMRNFLSLAPDQIHEQNNEKIKGLGGATHVLNRSDSTGLEEWRISGPELECLLSEFEEGFNKLPKFQTVFPNHEDTPAFQQQLTFDVRRVFKNLRVCS